MTGHSVVVTEVGGGTDRNDPLIALGGKNGCMLAPNSRALNDGFDATERRQLATMIPLLERLADEL